MLTFQREGRRVHQDELVLSISAPLWSSEPLKAASPAFSSSEPNHFACDCSFAALLMGLMYGHCAHLQVFFFCLLTTKTPAQHEMNAAISIPNEQ